MDNLFVYLLFGHIAGDYFLQNKKMAVTKGENSSQGYCWCIIHSLVYTASIYFFMIPLPSILNYFGVWAGFGTHLSVIHLPFLFYVLVFIQHDIFDKFSLGQTWLDFIKGRNILTAFNSSDTYRIIDIVFSCIVYTVVDNGMHLMWMWYVAKIMGV